MKKKAKPKYRVDIQWSDIDGCYVARVPELKGCATDGSTYEEAAANAQEAIEAYLGALDDMGKPHPKPMAERKFSGNIPLRIDPNLHRDLAAEAEEERTSINKLIERKLKRA